MLRKPASDDCRGPRSNRYTEKRGVLPPAVAVGFFLLASIAQAQVSESRLTEMPTSGPADLRLTGPATAPVGQPLTVVVSGLPGVDMAKTIGEQTEWINTIRFEVSAPGGQQIRPDAELSMAVSPWEWRLRVSFTPVNTGAYLLVCDWNQPPYGLALHRVEVGGMSPPIDPPDPPTDPTKPPPSLKATAAVYVYEKDQTVPPRAVQAALQQLNAGGSVVASAIDDDVVDGDGEIPDQYRSAIDIARKEGLPCLVVLAGDKILRTVGAPTTEQQVTEAVK